MAVHTAPKRAVQALERPVYLVDHRGTIYWTALRPLTPSVVGCLRASPRPNWDGPCLDHDGGGRTGQRNWCDRCPRPRAACPARDAGLLAPPRPRPAPGEAYAKVYAERHRAPPPKLEEWQRMLRDCLAIERGLTEWEVGFLETLAHSDAAPDIQQLAKLREVWEEKT